MDAFFLLHKSMHSNSFKDDFSILQFLLDRKVTKSEFSKGTKYLRDTGKKWLMERCTAIEAGDYVPEDALTLWVKAYGKIQIIRTLDQVYNNHVSNTRLKCMYNVAYDGG